MKQFKTFAWMMAIAIAGISMTDCSNDDSSAEAPFTTDPVEIPTLYACGVSPIDTRSGVEAQNVLFTEEDIEWFNVSTRELKFRDEVMPISERLKPYCAIEFRFSPSPEDVLLHVDNYVNLAMSQVFDNLVLCNGRIENGEVFNDCYYLNDCYPPQFINDERVQANREKNAPQWETFTKYLESKGKLKK